MRDLSISVTSLAEFISRAGNLSSGSFGGVSGIEGTRLHRRIFSDLKKQYGDDMDTEYSLSDSYEYNGLTLKVSGRADVIIGNDHIIEIKSFGSSKDSYEKLVRPEHEAQLAIYAYLYMEKNDLEKVAITLRYVSITTLEFYEDTQTITYDEAYRVFEHHCSEYMEFASKLMDYSESMVRSIKEMTFPYPEIRPGQAKLMKQTLISLCSKEVLFALAPTGTGKTISTLYPAVKGLLKGRYDKIFYLTAKTATRGVAAKAVNDMRKKGLIIRSIVLASKESMCFYKKRCDAKFCKYSEGYYSRLRPALSEALMLDDITPEIVSEIALKHQICPHEFSLDIMNFCTIVIGDYNHAFDPRVSLVRAFSEEVDSRNAVLIDEAHNMVDRAREMYSASFSYSLLKKMMSVFKGIDARTESYLQRLDQYFRICDQSMSVDQSAFKINEGADEHKILKTDHWEGMREMPKNFYGHLWRSIRLLSPILDAMPQGELRETATEYFFEARFFLTVFEQYFNDSYICSLSKEAGDITINLTCLDSSDKLDNLIKDKMPVVFFSATLSPYEYYRNVLIGKDADYCRSIELASPFPPENLEILIDTSISTVYKERALNLDKTVKRIKEEIINRRGNYMVFFPSFEFMNSVCSRLEKDLSAATKEDGIKRTLLLQTPGMSAEDKKNYLDAFSEANEGCLLGAAVLGGHFGEGIDLTGDRLSGVIIVGVGLPKITPERQILSNYYSEKFGDGFAFAYRYPGWEKVLQAVGRVIRTEEDTGFALLIDERLDKPEYLTLYPENWRV
ncbi:MAG: ATP-dependent DNA helicase [Saccharofermentans sp.]|nr:ATP-dependent DNA helicase [Saccharofermentans sp.]